MAMPREIECGVAMPREPRVWCGLENLECGVTMPREPRVRGGDA